MRAHLNGMIGRMATPILLGAALISIGSVVYAFLCPGMFRVTAGPASPSDAFLIQVGTAGAVCGAILGLCLAVDRAASQTGPVAPIRTPPPTPASATRTRSLTLAERRRGRPLARRAREWGRLHPARSSRALGWHHPSSGRDA
jgi:hypothetical protein